MAKSSTQAKQTPTPTSLFFSMGLDMSWRLALGVLIPIIAGAELDQHAPTAPFGLLAGFALAIAGAFVTIRYTVRLANSNPVLNSKPEVKHD